MAESEMGSVQTHIVEGISNQGQGVGHEPGCEVR